MNLYKSRTMLIITTLLYANLFIALISVDFTVFFNMIGYFLAYLIGFRTPYEISFEKSRVVVKCYFWRYSYNYNILCSVMDINTHFAIMFKKRSLFFGKWSIFFVLKDLVFFDLLNNEFINKLPSEMQKRFIENDKIAK